MRYTAYLAIAMISIAASAAMFERRQESCRWTVIAYLCPDVR